MTFARVRALIFVAVLFVTAGVVVIMAIGRDTQTRPVNSANCPPGLVPAKTQMPERGQVTVNVINGTTRVPGAPSPGVMTRSGGGLRREPG